jgi:hypothetical protein
MSHESKLALERIVAICERSENLTPRQVRIFDIALEGLGLVSGQRAEIVAKWKQPHIDKIIAKRARQAANYAGNPP